MSAYKVIGPTTPERTRAESYRADRVPGIVDPEARVVYLGHPGDFHEDVREDHGLSAYLPWIAAYSDGSYRDSGSLGDEVREAVARHLGRPLQQYVERGDPWKLAKTAGMTPAQVERLAEERGLPEDGSEVVHRFPDGWTIRRLNTMGDQRREGVIMNHCWDTEDPGADPVPLGPDSNYYSLRDPNNIPKASFYYFAPDHEVWNRFWGNGAKDLSAFGGETPSDAMDAYKLDYEERNDAAWETGDGLDPISDYDALPDRPGTPHHVVYELFGHGDAPPKPEYRARVDQWVSSLGGDAWEAAQQDDSAYYWRKIAAHYRLAANEWTIEELPHDTYNEFDMPDAEPWYSVSWEAALAPHTAAGDSWEDQPRDERGRWVKNPKWDRDWNEELDEETGELLRWIIRRNPDSLKPLARLPDGTPIFRGLTKAEDDSVEYVRCWNCAEVMVISPKDKFNACWSCGYRMSWHQTDQLLDSLEEIGWHDEDWEDDKPKKKSAVDPGRALREAGFTPFRSTNHAEIYSWVAPDGVEHRIGHSRNNAGAEVWTRDQIRKCRSGQCQCAAAQWQPARAAPAGEGPEAVRSNSRVIWRERPGVVWTVGQVVDGIAELWSGEGESDLVPVRELEMVAGWRLAAMERLGASVEELAREMYEDLMGFQGKKEEGHRPPRPDIAKMKEAYENFREYRRALKGPETGPNREVMRWWHDEMGLEGDEIALVERYRAARRAFGDPQQAFEDAVAWAADALPRPMGQQEARRALGAALKKFERQHWPQLYAGIERLLADLYRTNAESYKMWPWAVREAKAAFQEWLAADAGYNPASADVPAALRGTLDHLVDIVREGGALLHQLRANNAAGLPDVNQMDLREFEEWLMEWKRENRAAEGRGEVVYEWPDGWTVQRLRNSEQCQWEGDEMGHCVGGYGQRVESGDTLIYSLRDRRGEPHATLEIRPSVYLTDVLGGPAIEPNGRWREEAVDDSSANRITMSLLESQDDIDHYRQLLNEGRSDLIRQFYPAHLWEVHAVAPEEAGGLPEGAAVERGDYAMRYAVPVEKGKNRLVFEIVQIQGRGDGRPKDEYAERLKEWFADVRERTGARFEWGPDGDYHGGDDHDRESLAYPEIDDAAALSDWHSAYWDETHALYAGGGEDRYGLETGPVEIRQFDPEEVMRECAMSLIDDYDRDRWKTSDWKGLADATYAAAVHAGYSREQFQRELERAEESLSEWVSDFVDHALYQGGYDWDELRDTIERKAAEEGWDPDEELGEGWGFAAVEEARPDTAWEAREEYEEKVEEAYAGNAHRYFQRLYDLANVEGGGWPGWGHAPHPRDMPGAHELAEWRDAPRGALDIPGALSKAAAGWGDAEIPTPPVPPAPPELVRLPPVPGGEIGQSAFMNRLPWTYDAIDNRVYVGSPGEYHSWMLGRVPDEVRAHPSISGSIYMGRGGEWVSAAPHLLDIDGTWPDEWQLEGLPGEWLGLIGRGLGIAVDPRGDPEEPDADRPGAPAGWASLDAVPGDRLVAGHN
jgi:hypothetical protein